MSQNNNKLKNIMSNPFIFIGVIALIASLVLSLTSETFKERVKANKKLDKMKNVLMCRYLENISEFENSLSDPEWILNEFDNIIETKLFDLNESVILDDDQFDFADLIWKEDKKDGSLYFYFIEDLTKRYLPVFCVKDAQNDLGYIVSISGKGLWSTLKGFLYIENDFETVKGISVYEHKETPGLGGEIDKDYVKKRYVDTKINLNLGSEDEVISVYMKKSPKQDNLNEIAYMSGATITSDGLNSFIKRDLERYKPVFELIKGQY